ncbi:pseudaminic acid synthase [Candidatus Pelagibacter sp.]|nr:pseudaminic acid synthase [Candidatus Pelagibacter sp.]
MIKIGNKTTFSYKKSPLIIAEISGNHSGNKKKFLRLIDSAYKNGADLVKIQSYEPLDITLNSKKSNYKIKSGVWKNKYLWDLYKKACTPFSWHHEAFQIAKKNKKILFSSPFSVRAVDLLEKFEVKLYKISSFELTDFNLVDYIASKKKPIIISTGMASLDEIKKVKKIINKYHNKIIFLHCVSNYPTKLKDMSLFRIEELKKIFKKNLIGLSDHTNEIYSSIASVPIGVVAIEKHYKFKGDKTPDSKFSISKNQLSNLKIVTEEIFESLKYKKKKLDKNNKSLRRSLFVKKNIKKNEKFTRDNIKSLRPKLGIPAEHFFDIIGKRANKNLIENSPIKFKDIKQK